MNETGHRVVEAWMDEPVETLADLLRDGLRAICVGINPSPVSVAAGHYYQGRLGQQLFARLRESGLLPGAIDGYEDDAAFAAGIGFTDIVKRPSAREKDVRREEFEHGRELLVEKLERHRPGLVIFTFKKTATKLFGAFEGNGFREDLQIGGAEVFVMPGPYEAHVSAQRTLEALASRARPNAAGA